MRENNGVEMSAKNLSGQTARRIGFVFLLIFFILATGIFISGYLAVRNYERHYRIEVERQLSAVSDLKVSELVQLRKSLRDSQIIT